MIPGSPQKPHGIRIDPPPSVPRASGTIPAASAAELPPLDPPAVRVTSHGLRVTPSSGPWVTPFQPNSGVVVLPTATAPLRASAATDGASTSHARSGSTAREPRSVGHPAVSSTSLIATGTPSSSPAGSPRDQRAWEPRGGLAGAVGVDEPERVDRGVLARDPLERRVERLERREHPAGEVLEEPVASGGSGTREARCTADPQDKGRRGRYLGLPSTGAARRSGSKDEVWNPEVRRVFVPKSFGWGYGVNLHSSGKARRRSDDPQALRGSNRA